MKTLTVLGLMSGTSLDGVDYAWCRIGPDGIRLLELIHRAFPARLGTRLRAAAAGRADSHETAQLHHDLGRFYARGALAGSRPRTDLCGLHGQTIFHRPHPRSPATFQLGEPSYLAQALRVPVIHNFRAADLAVGGVGAPLATDFHREIFARRKTHTCVNNLGGISNVTSLDWRAGQEPAILSFDTGPGNLLLDLAARHYTKGRRRMDRDGHLAQRGQARPELWRRWLRHPYFHQKPPKSTGREMFGESHFRKLLDGMNRAGLAGPDAMATLCAFTAQSLALNYRAYLPALPQRVILTGGGAANPVLVRHIEAALAEGDPKPEVTTASDWGWPWAGVEPAAFAWLAWKRWHGLSGHHTATTGATRAVWLGQITQLG